MGVLVAALLVALVAQGYARRQVGRSTTVAPGAPAPAPPGSLLPFSQGAIRRVSPPRMTVALTFDDGPDSAWTPKLLDLLRERNVPATFFVVGAQVVSHPELVRRELAEGHDVGSHTFTHADLGSLPTWRQNLELSLTRFRGGQPLRLPCRAEEQLRRGMILQFGAGPHELFDRGPDLPISGYGFEKRDADA